MIPLLRRRVGMGTAVLFALLAQTALLPHLQVGGVMPDVMIVVVVAIAAREGPETGAVVGFVAGVLIDLFLEVPLGLSALAYTVVGYGVGAVQTGLLRERWWLSPLLAGVGSLTAGLIFTFAGVILGQEYLMELRTFVVMPTRSFYDAVLALAVFPLVGRLLGPADEAALPYRGF